VIVEHIVGSAGTGLIPTRVIRHSLDIVSPLPEIARAFGYELRLAPDGGPVDCGFVIASPAALLRATSRGAALDPTGRDPGWKSIARLARRWADARHEASRALSAVFFEYDAESSGRYFPIPSLFARFNSGVRPSDPTAATEFAADLFGITQRSHGPALGALTKLFDLLPAGGEWTDVATLLSRPGRGLRAGFSVPLASAALLLKSTGWPATASFESLLARFPFTSPIRLQIDLPPAAEASVGLEAIGAAGMDDMVVWRTLSETLVSTGLASADRTRALFAIPGESFVPVPRSYPVRITRQISHIKVSWSPSHPPFAKGYFVCVPQLQPI
jgi:hypothetical protein